MKFVLLTLFAIITIEINAQEMPSKVDIMTDEIRKELNASYNATNTGGFMIAGGALIAIVTSLIANYEQSSNRNFDAAAIGRIGFYIGGGLIGVGGLKIKQGAKKRQAVLQKYGY